jgi:hypothetical protein
MKKIQITLLYLSYLISECSLACTVFIILGLVRSDGHKLPITFSHLYWPLFLGILLWLTHLFRGRLTKVVKAELS